MRMIEIDQYNEQTMSIALPLLDGEGNVLAAPFSILQPHSQIEIKELGIKEIVVHDMDSSGIALDDMVDISPWMQLIETVRISFQAAAEEKRLPLDRLFRGADLLIDSVKRQKYGIPLPLTMVPNSLKMYAHAVNVAFISLQIGVELGYQTLQLHDLAIGCLLHDIGKAVTQEESRHAEAGYHLLCKYKEINLLSAQIAYQHHESFEGNGYPRGLKETEILELAQVCAVANLYDHLLSLESIARHEGQAIILALKDLMFKEQVVNAFDRAIPSYIPGTKIRVHQGEEAIVSSLSKHVHRPIIRYIRTGEVVDLSTQPNLYFSAIAE